MTSYIYIYSGILLRHKKIPCHLQQHGFTLSALLMLEGQVNKSETVKYYMISYVESEKTTLMKNAENRSLVARGRGRRVGRMGEGSQKVQTSGYKTHMFWACNVQHGDYS